MMTLLAWSSESTKILPTATIAMEMDSGTEKPVNVNAYLPATVPKNQSKNTGMVILPAHASVNPKEQLQQ